MLPSPPSPPIEPALRQTWPRPQTTREVVLIGAGGIVNDAHLPAYEQLELKVRGIFDPDAQRAAKTAADFSIPQVYTRLEDAVSPSPSSNLPPIFDIAVPPGAVLSTVSALPEGSACLIQKPLGLNLSQATEIRSVCREAKLVAAVNFQLRFSPMVLALKDAIARGLLGDLVEFDVHVNVRTPWHLWPFMESLEHMEIAMHSIHYLDCMRSLLGEPRGVHACTIQHPEAARLTSSRTSAIFDYGSKIRASVVTNHHHPWGARHERSEMRVEGTRGCAVLTMGVNLNYPEGRPDRLELASVDFTDPATTNSNNQDDHWFEVKLAGQWFPDAFRGTMSNLQRFASGDDRELHTSVEDAWRTMALVEACYESSAGGGTPFAPDSLSN